MKFSVMTLFPEMIERVLNESIIGRAQKNGIITVDCHNIRDFSKDKHRRVDDYPFGGGGGMIMQCQPIYDCYQEVLKSTNEKPYTVYVSPRGNVLNQKKVRELSKHPHLAVLCGHYEGVDQRVLDEIIDEEISIGDYVLTGGELPACILIDSIARMLPGVLAEESSYEEESHYNGLLEHPQYTQPREWNGREVPAVLTEGNHRLINRWKQEQSIALTQKMRPDLIRRPIPDGKRLRQVEESDRELLLDYMDGFYGGPGVLHPVPRKNNEETIRQLLDGNPYLNAYIIQFERKPVGYCLLSHAYSNPAGGLVVWIEQIYIDPPYRGHKLADKALRELFAIYDDTAKCYRLEVTEDNKIAKKIYYRLGFKMQGYQQMIKE